ncbi:MAG: hypothetical protein JW941_07690 [Candidatus Coatesbacteria bacterium]|nr:hypothetical protein [Candidatus Coatesbacteria bacterium]
MTNGVEAFWTWVAAFLTLCIFSFLYKDNPFYKFAEHLVVGVSVGYFVIIDYYNYLKPNVVVPLGNTIRTGEHLINLLLIVPILMGFLMLLRVSPKYGSLSRLSIAFLMGVNSGVAIGPTMEAWMIQQIKATIFDFKNLEFFYTGLNALLLLIGVITTLIFFFFSKEHKGALGGGARIGVTFLMVGFGASFGYTVMARISLLIGRLQFLLKDWLGLIN